MSHAQSDLLERLAVLPGGALLLEAALEEPCHLVGGAVRDILLERRPRELDVVVEGDSQALARRLAQLAGVPAPVVLHERFGTATVRLAAGARVDLASARSERYEAPGALPVVAPASLREDLLRRDFTVNAIALSLGGPRPGELIAPDGALEDLRGGLLRILHEQSFRDDPTRLLRLARYVARLGFRAESHTLERAREALGGGALATVSGARVGAELRLALAEPGLAAPAVMAEQGILRAIHPRLGWDAALVARALRLLDSDDGALADRLALAAIVLPLTLRAGDQPRAAEARLLLARLEFPARDRERALLAALAAPRLLDVLSRPVAPSALHEALQDVPPEGVALAAALAAGATAEAPDQRLRRREDPAEQAARLWLSQLRHVRLLIDGRDLIAAGLPEGPDIGRRLEVVLRKRLDGDLAGGRDAELQAALQA